jgi:IstB-like ATP binding protein
MIDRLVHHAQILSLKGDSYRLKHRDLGGRPPTHLRARNGVGNRSRRALAGPQIASQRLGASRQRP